MSRKSSVNIAPTNLDLLAKLMDSQFKIPGTSIRFGLDAVMGLIPGLGDISTFLVSVYILLMLAKKGASGFLLARMTLNIVLDTIIGSIPVIGDVFDIAFKSNQRNLKLMREHYLEGRHNGSAGKIIIPVLFILLLLIGGILWVSYKFFSWLYHIIW
ncbi:MAG: DUF4112 domain-containing protein [Bacteroidia bacterium]|nr:DUF4112 domain-containing protein [Bacteroidia bacterium]